MATEVLRVLDRAAEPADLARAGRLLREGGLVAFPTETVYGIAVSAHRPDAVERLYALKGRERGKAMTMMLADTGPLFERCPQVPAAARALMKRFWPGPLTLVIPDPEGRLCGFRLPASPLARGLVREAGVPLLVPSANLSGQPPAVTAEQVLEQLPVGLDLLIDGGTTEGGVASTVVKVTVGPDGKDVLEILREGAIPEARILLPGGANILYVCTGNTDRSPLMAAIVRRRLAEALRVKESELPARGFQIQSAGLAAQEGRRASVNVRKVGREWPGGPLDLEGHVARRVTRELVECATRIYCMERAQRDQILAFFPHRERDVSLLDPELADIDDPDGMGLSEFKRLARRLDAVAALHVGGLVSCAS